MNNNSLTASVQPIILEDSIVSTGFLADISVFVLANGHVFFSRDENNQLVKVHNEGIILCAAFDEDRLVTGGDDGCVVLTNMNGVCETIVTETSKWIDAVAIREGAIAWSAGHCISARSIKGETRSLSLNSSSRGLKFFPKGYRLAIAHYNGATLWFPNASSPELLRWNGSHLDITISPDARFVITSMQENTLHGWRLTDNKNMRMAGYPSKTRSFSWSHDGKWLATSGADACIIWPFIAKDGPMGQTPRECGLRPEIPVTCVAFHPSAPVVAIGYEDGMVILTRLSDASEILVRHPSKAAKIGRINAINWNKQGSRLCFGAENGEGGTLTLPSAS